MISHRGLSDSNLLTSPGHVPMFWRILEMLESVWSPFAFLFPSLPVSLLILRRLFQVYKLQLFSPPALCSVRFVFLAFRQNLRFNLFSFSFTFILSSTGTAGSLSLLTITRSGCLVKIKWSVLCQNPMYFVRLYYYHYYCKLKLPQWYKLQCILQSLAIIRLRLQSVTHLHTIFFLRITTALLLLTQDIKHVQFLVLLLQMLYIFWNFYYNDILLCLYHTRGIWPG